MDLPVTATLAFINDVLQAIIVIFGAAVVLYNLGQNLRVRTTRAFCALITFVVIVYLTELLVSRAMVTGTDAWLHLEWVGITLVPAAQYHLSDALLSTTGANPIRRRMLVRIFYAISIGFMALALWTPLVVGEAIHLHRVRFLQAGPLFPLFTIYFWVTAVISTINVWQARQRCLTSTTKRRMTSTLFAFMAAPLGVFPYMVLSNRTNDNSNISSGFWLLLILGNLVVSAMFAVQTSHLAYFGAVSPDRVVRVRLYKFMARVPLAATAVLLVYVLVSRASSLFGLETDTALGFALVATLMLVEWAIHAYKRPFERLFHLNEDPDIVLIQKLSERLLTTRDLHQFLEGVLAGMCEALRTPTAFVAAITPDGPKLEVVVGSLGEPTHLWADAEWKAWLQLGTNSNGAKDEETELLETVDDFIIWRNYWIRPLYNRKKDIVLGILGIRARSDAPDLDENEHALFADLVEQANVALEDRVLQQEVFAAVEGLLPEVTALQAKRVAVTFGSLPAIPPETTPPLLTDQAAPDALVNDPEFSSMVRDALNHYWGGPKLSESPLIHLKVVQQALSEHGSNPVATLRAILNKAIEEQKPEGERNLSATEWVLYNILEMKFVQGQRVRDVARRLAVSESDLYRKQRVAIENVARTVATMETAVTEPEKEAP